MFAMLAGLVGAPAEAQELRNCGYVVEIGTPPSRIVTIKSTATDLLLALGLGDRIVGQAFQDGPPVAGFEEEAAACRGTGR